VEDPSQKRTLHSRRVPVREDTRQSNSNPGLVMCPDSHTKRKNLGPQARSEAARNQTFFKALDPALVALGFEMPSSSARAVRYRKLALAAKHRADAELLLKLADECDRGLLCTTERISARPSFENDEPLKAGAKERYEWGPLNDRR
jgi:hypothetical protein